MVYSVGMASYITNFETLATTPLRRDALTIVEAAYRSIDTKLAIQASCSFHDGVLTLGSASYKVDEYEHVYLIGFGKASCSAVQALESLLEGKVKEGIVIDKSPGVCEVVKVYQGSHPLPTPHNVELSQMVADLAIRATEKDLVIVVVSGGGSALLCWPLSECEQSDKLYKAFVTTSGTITELNTLRKHVSSIKGGGLAKLLYPATVAALIFSDVPGDFYESVASGPTYKDASTIASAEAVLAKYGITETFNFVETPKEDIYFEKVTNIPLVSNLVAVQGMKEKAESLGYTAIVLSTSEYRLVDQVLKEMKSHLAPKTAVIVAGEPSITLTHGRDTSGRNEYAASVLLEMIGDHEVCISFATDGIDNKSIAAGALIDKEAKERSEKDSKYALYLQEGKYDALCNELGIQLITGATGSNVSDCILYLHE